MGIIKLNLDGVIRSTDGTTASGGVSRDEDSFRCAWRKMYQGITDPLTIEALVLRDAVRLALDENYDQIIAETNSSELARLWSEQ
jgi:hypothetical protein